ncbi:MAG TPA: YaiO family outer membrane beta-barrel protein [Prolixibacteraceae bacterium]
MRQKENALIKIIGLLLAATISLTVVGQKGLSDSIPSAELLLKARDAAFNNRKVEARQLCRQILLRDSTYWDAAVLMGRTYAWDQKYDSARIVLKKIIMAEPGYYDAVDALIDNELYCGNNLEAIKYADLGLSSHPNEASFLYKKARALNNSGNSLKASEILNHIISIDPTDKKAVDLLLSIKENKMINQLKLNYWADYFSDQDSWQFFSAALGRKTARFGTVILRYNNAERFSKVGHQLEIDAYPTLAKSVYLYFNTGISNATNFPISRLTLEPYFKLPKGFEFSAGIRYMNFDKTRLVAIDSNKVIIYTGTIGKYIGSYWISVRPYFISGNKAWSKSVNLTFRRYLDDADSYLSLVLGSGISPDVQQYAYDPNYFLKSNKITLEYRQKMAKHFFLDLAGGFAREEILAGVKHDKYSIDLGISYLF